jgi:hypothetical protein
LRSRGLGELQRFERSIVYGSAPESRAIRADRAIAALERAVHLSSLDDSGRKLRLELAQHLLAEGKFGDAERTLGELVQVTPADERTEITVRLALAQGSAGKDALAAETFARARGALTAKSGVSRALVLSGELAARYRAGQYATVLALASDTWDELGKPPAPPPPPPPPPRAVQKKPSKQPSAQAGILSLLGQDTAILGVLGPLSDGFSEDDVVRLATDAVERLDAAQQIPGDPSFQSAVVTRLAVRALYRDDERAAREHAARAVRAAAATARDAYRVLEILARRDGDSSRAGELLDKRRKLPYGRGNYGADLEHAWLDREERTSKPGAPKSGHSPAERGVRSLVRLCTEPAHQRLPAPVGNAPVATFELAAKLFESGQVSVEARSDRQSQPLAEIVTCLEQVGPRVLAGAPASIDAKIAFDRSVLVAQERTFGGLLGDSIGEGGGGIGAIGIGGLGSGLGTGTGPRKPPAKPEPAPKKTGPP